jgi:hypothetical protein
MVAVGPRLPQEGLQPQMNADERGRALDQSRDPVSSASIRGFKTDSSLLRHLGGLETMRTLLATLTMCLLAVPVQAQYSGGTGVSDDPYQIATAADLIALGETPEDYDKHFLLTADIDLAPNLPGGKVFDKAVIAPDTDPSEYSGFNGAPFTGVFDGNDHRVLHLTITGGDFLGLFGQLGQRNLHPGCVQNLGVVDVDVAGSSYVGGLAGQNQGTVAACYSSGSVSGSGVSVGGLVGCNYFGSIASSYSTGTVLGNRYVGGLTGWNDGNVTACSSAGTVRGDQDVGGLVGISRQSLVSQCYSSASVSGEDSVGGLVGALMQSVIRQCYSCGLVSGVRAGGILGRWGGGYVQRSFWDVETSGQTESAGGTGLTTGEMQDSSTFLDAGWDFVGETANGPNDVWKIAEGLDYPRLWWETTEE